MEAIEKGRADTVGVTSVAVDQGRKMTITEATTSAMARSTATATATATGAT